MASTVGWRVIGEVAVLVDARKADLRGQRQSEILALLLTRAGQTVSLSVICEELWGAEQPKTAKNSVQRFIADIRRAHGEHASLLQTVPLGYRLDASPADVDIGRAKALITAAADHRCRDEAELARVSLVEALDLLTGIAFPGLRPLPFVLVAEVHIDELSTQAIEQLADVQIDLGLFDEAAAGLPAMWPSIRSRRAQRQSSCKCCIALGASEMRSQRTNRFGAICAMSWACSRAANCKNFITRF